MPVNTAALKTFAPAMRRQLLEAVGRKLDLVLHSQTPDTLSTYAKQIAELRAQVAENREQLLERVAYTWFNRLCALRYLDARGWHPFGCKVLMPAAEGETQPELLKLMRAGNLPAGLQAHVEVSRLHGLLDGQIQTAIAGADPQGEVYRDLVLATSRFYHELLPNLFEALDDLTELLLPDDLLTEGSIAGAFRSAIMDGDCEDVEIIGWLYQFYIAEKKDEVMARKKAVPSEDIPAVTQLFTPHWIVRYLVENSLGRLWLRSRPNSCLREHMPYYVEDPEGETPTGSLTVATPEEIKLLDPACGSGHMLTFAFDLLVKIYEEEGHAPSEIPEKILTHNLFGLEICPRAAQLAQFALVCKAREQSRAAFRRPVQPQVMCLRNVVLTPDEMQSWTAASGVILGADELAQIHQFRKNTEAFGALIQPVLDGEKLAALVARIDEQAPTGDVLVQNSHRKLQLVLDQAQMLSQRYQVVVANPPYMGGGGMTAAFKSYLSQAFPAGKLDTMTCFMERASSLVISRGVWGMINLPSWLFLGSFARLRKEFIQKNTLHSLLHLGRGVFGADFGSVAFVVENSLGSADARAIFRRLFKQHSIVRSPGEIEAHFLRSGEDLHVAEQQDFLKIPGCPLTYWYSQRVYSAFEGPPMTDLASPMIGIQSGDNSRFYRLWWENIFELIEFRTESLKELEHKEAWIPLQRGGDARKWYGNNVYTVNLSYAGRAILQTANASLRNSDKYFNESVSWNRLSNGRFFVRWVPKGAAFDDVSPFAVALDADSTMLALAILGSAPSRFFVKAFSTGYKTEVGHVSSIPIPSSIPKGECVRERIESLIKISRADWDNFETSWDFRDLPLLRPGDWEVEPGRVEGAWKGRTLAESWANYASYCAAAIRRMQELETENNRLWNDAYGLQDELDPAVPEEEITLARADARKDLAAFLSYATGCMMGRYSLDQQGLILADSRDSQAEQLAAYEDKVGKPISDVQFKPDPDGILPVLDGEWFEDDIVARTREFLTVTFPESSVAENLRFIEESLGKDIRKYFCSEFYKDHLQTYKKRPIYWMVQSPKKGFACLIYLHRYTKDTLNQVLNNYFRPYLQKLEARLAQLGLDQLNDDLPARERTAARKEAEKITKVLKECQAWEQDALLPLAQQRIELDLDDGVKVNYLKLQDVLAPIPGLAAKED